MLEHTCCLTGALCGLKQNVLMHANVPADISDILRTLGPNSYEQGWKVIAFIVLLRLL